DADDVTRPVGTHDGKHGARHVERAEEVRLELGAEVRVRDLLERARDEVARVVDEHVDPAEPCNGCVNGSLSAGRVGDIELGDEQVVVRTDRGGDRVGRAAGGDDGVAGVQCGAGQID